MSLTIEEIKKKKITLESSILKLVKEFEKETDTFISYINFARKVSKDENAKNYHQAIPEPERSGPVENVDVNMRFDL